MQFPIIEGNCLLLSTYLDACACTSFWLDIFVRVSELITGHFGRLALHALYNKLIINILAVVRMDMFIVI